MSQVSFIVQEKGVLGMVAHTFNLSTQEDLC